VTQLAFAPDEKGAEGAPLLLSVSRDRSWALHQLHLAEDDQLTVKRLAASGMACFVRQGFAQGLYNRWIGPRRHATSSLHSLCFK
jgi:hypothetical protein